MEQNVVCSFRSKTSSTRMELCGLFFGGGKLEESKTGKRGSLERNGIVFKLQPSECDPRQALLLVRGINRRFGEQNCSLVSALLFPQ